MLVASGLAVAMKPERRMADSAPKIDLEAMIPKQFGGWQVDGSVVPIQVSPDVRARLDKIYSQTLSRTYVNERGDRVMLVIAYGGDQSDTMQVHRPEVCYPAQGFQVLRTMVGTLATDFGELPVKRLLTRLGPRNEPVTYWVVVGNIATARNSETKIAQLKYGLFGQVPDGVLVRVSAIDSDATRSFTAQDSFVRSMLAALADNDRARIAGAH